MADITDEESSELMKGFSFGQAAKVMPAVDLTPDEAELMEGFSIDGILANKSEVMTGRQRLQELLVRQAKGEEGLQQEIDVMRSRVGEPDTDSVAKTFIPQSEASIVDKAGVGMRDVITGEMQQTRATKELPELPDAEGLLSGYNSADVNKFIALAAVTPNPRELANIAKSMFPTIGVTEDEQGNMMLYNPSSGVRAVINKPGVSKLDLLQTGAQGAALSMGGVMPSLAKTALKEGGIQAAVESAQTVAGGEFNPADVAIAGVSGAVGQKLGDYISGGIGDAASAVSTGAKKLFGVFDGEPTNTTEQVIKAIKSKDPLELAKVVDADPEIIKAATDLGVNDKVLLQTISRNQQFQEVSSGIGSLPMSETRQAMKNETDAIINKANEFITQFGGSKDKAAVFGGIQNKVLGVIKASEQTESKIYDDIATKIDSVADVDTPAVKEFFSDLLPKIKNNVASMTKGERIIYRTLFDKDGNYVTPSYEMLNRLRKQIGEGLSQGKGAFKDESKGELKNFYGMLRRDQDDAILSLNPELLPLVKDANAMTVRRKVLEDNAKELFGNNLEKELGKQFKIAINGLKDHNIKDFNRLITAIPQEYRQEAIVTALNNSFKGAGRTGNDLNIPQFASWYKSISDSPVALKALNDVLPEGAPKMLDDLGRLVIAVNKGRSEATSTGRIVEVSKRLESTIGKFVGSIGLPAKFEAVGQAAAGLPGLGWMLGRAMKGQDDILLKMDKTLANKVFQDVAETYAKQGVEAAEKSARGRAARIALESSKQFKAWLGTLPEATALQIKNNGIYNWLDQKEAAEDTPLGDNYTAEEFKKYISSKQKEAK